MAERVAINTGPLVALARMDALEIAGLLPLEFVCPREVQAELQEGVRRGHIPVAAQWLRTQELKRPLSPAAVASLDAAEAAMIQMALEQGIAWVCMDELKGRRAAASAGLKVVGALGLLGMAKTHGLILTMRPFVDKALIAGVHYDQELIRRVLAAAGE